MVIFLIVVPGGNSRVWLKSCPHRTQSGNRQYVLAVGALKGDPKNMEARKNYDKLASSFFDSFKKGPGYKARIQNFKDYFENMTGSSNPYVATAFKHNYAVRAAKGQSEK